jgi:hypothetical protein
MEMIDLRDCTVKINNEKEYRAITKMAIKQGFEWASGSSLNNIMCEFPTRLEFKRNHCTYYGAWIGCQPRDYPNCMVLIKGVRKLILIRQKGRTND